MAMPSIVVYTQFSLGMEYEYEHSITFETNTTNTTHYKDVPAMSPLLELLMPSSLQRSSTIVLMSFSDIGPVQCSSEVCGEWCKESGEY